MVDGLWIQHEKTLGGDTETGETKKGMRVRANQVAVM